MFLERVTRVARRAVIAPEKEEGREGGRGVIKEALNLAIISFA